LLTDCAQVRLRPDRTGGQRHQGPWFDAIRQNGVQVEITSRWLCPGAKRYITHRHAYTVRPDGTLAVANTFTMDKRLPEVPRLGVTLVLPPALEQLAWFGRGPWENYSDRKRSALVAHHRSTVTDQYVPYILPQEHGNKTDVRWLALHDGAGQGVRFAATGRLMEASASHFTAADLYAAKHTTDLTPRPEVHVNLDYAQRGLGTASCGPDALPQYRIQPGTYRLDFSVSPTDAASEQEKSLEGGGLVQVEAQQADIVLELFDGPISTRCGLASPALSRGRANSRVACSTSAKSRRRSPFARPVSMATCSSSSRSAGRWAFCRLPGLGGGRLEDRAEAGHEAVDREDVIGDRLACRPAHPRPGGRALPVVLEPAGQPSALEGGGGGGKAEVQDAAADRRQQRVGPGGEQQQGGVGRRLLEGLEKDVRRGEVHAVGLVHDGDLARWRP
jgi:hypothetical protein